MDKLKYKTFVWPHNPTVYKEEYLREPQYCKGDDGEYYFDAMGDEKLTITGTGHSSATTPLPSSRSWRSFLRRRRRGIWSIPSGVSGTATLPGWK